MNTHAQHEKAFFLDRVLFIEKLNRKFKQAVAVAFDAFKLGEQVVQKQCTVKVT